jgi:hypothetical protein
MMSERDRATPASEVEKPLPNGPARSLEDFHLRGGRSAPR